MSYIINSPNCPNCVNFKIPVGKHESATSILFKSKLYFSHIQDTLDFLAYIAKNEDEWRACYVLECIGGQSEDLIVTIGKAFMLRYNAISRKG